MKLHHIGLVVPKIQDSIGDLTKFINFETIGMPNFVGSQKVNACLLKIGEPFLELIEPLEKDSPIYEFAEKGGGVHHICFQVSDIHAEVERMKKNGATVLVSPIIAFDNWIIAFVDLNTKKTNCCLIELLEIKN